MHNYLKKIQALLKQSRTPWQPRHYSMGIAHDDWCQIYLGGPCNCDPDISIIEVTAANREEIIAKIANDTSQFRRKRQEKTC
jgi:hypothetical protein